MSAAELLAEYDSNPIYPTPIIGEYRAVLVRLARAEQVLAAVEARHSARHSPRPGRNPFYCSECSGLRQDYVEHPCATVAALRDEASRG